MMIDNEQNILNFHKYIYIHILSSCARVGPNIDVYYILYVYNSLSPAPPYTKHNIAHTHKNIILIGAIKVFF